MIERLSEGFVSGLFASPASALSAAGFACSIVAVLLAYSQYKRRLRTERLLVRMLEERLKHAHSFRRILESEELLRLTRDHDLMARYQDLVHGAVRELSRRDRESVERALAQPSQKGRARYLQKLFEESVAGASHHA